MNEVTKTEKEIMVSIVCLTYNHAPFVEKAINGFLMQKTNFRYEIIIHDDASTDGTADIIRRYAKEYPGLFVTILQTENQYSKHVKITPKVVHENARGKYIALCDGDDYWIDENKLQKQVDYMESHPNCSICGHNSYFLDNKDSAKSVFKDTVNPSSADTIISMKEYLESDRNPVPQTATLLLRKDLMPDYSWSRRFSFGDLFWELSALDKGYCFYFNDVMAIYRINNPRSYNGKMTSNNVFEKNMANLSYWFEMIEAFEYFNIETKYRWDESIKIAKRRIRYEILSNYYLEILAIKRPWKVFIKCIIYRNCLLAWGYDKLKSIKKFFEKHGE